MFSRLLVGCFLFYLIKAILANSECSHSSSASSVEGNLRNHLLCDYDSRTRPVENHKNRTNVTFALILKSLEYDHFMQRFGFDAWIDVVWRDQHLTWTPSDFEGINRINIMVNEIWYPDLSIYNRHDQSSDPNIISGVTSCELSFEGRVQCIIPIHFDILCVPDLKHFPFDLQTCPIQIGSWGFNGERVYTAPNSIDPVNYDDIPKVNGEWQFESYIIRHNQGIYDCCPNLTFPTTVIAITIKRNSHLHAINVVLPLIVCMLLTMTTMFMSPLNKNRFFLGCVSLISHIFHLQNLLFAIPNSGGDIPVLATISRDSTLLTGIAVILTLILKSMLENKNECPVWLSAISSALIASRPGQIIFLQDYSFKNSAAAQKKDDSDIIISNNAETLSASATSNISDWSIVGKFLDIALFLCYILVYIILLISI